MRTLLHVKPRSWSDPTRDIPHDALPLKDAGLHLLGFAGKEYWNQVGCLSLFGDFCSLGRKGCRSCSCLCLMATMCDHEALHLLTMITGVIRFHVPRGTCKLDKRPRALPYQCGTVRSRAKSFCLSAKHARSLRNTLFSGSTSPQGTFAGPACADSDLESQGVVLLYWRRTSEAS